MSLILITAIIGIGAVVGLVAIRDHVATEFGDVAVGLDKLNQSFSYVVSVDGNQDGDFDDVGGPGPDFIFKAGYPAEPNDDGTPTAFDTSTLNDGNNSAPACLTFVAPAASESAVQVQQPPVFP